MPLRLPRHLRILVIPDDDRSSREYTITRRMIICLGLLTAGVMALVVFVLLSYASLESRVRRVPDLQRELAEAGARLATVDDLTRELEQMRSLQERLLVMLGVQGPAPAPVDRDTLAGAFLDPGQPAPADTASVLEQTAALVMTAPPDLWPVAGFVTREFREGDTRQGILPHQGIDIAAPEDSPLAAAGRGLVLEAEWDDHLGNFVEIQHGFGYVTVYGHCSRLAVRKGDRIDRGQVIGYLGGTGKASAPHLHLEIWKDGVAVDPRRVLGGDPPR